MWPRPTRYNLMYLAQASRGHGEHIYLDRTGRARACHFRTPWHTRARGLPCAKGSWVPPNILGRMFMVQADMQYQRMALHGERGAREGTSGFISLLHGPIH